MVAPATTYELGQEGASMESMNRQYRLAARPVGTLKPSDFELVEAAVGEPGEGEVLVRVLYASIDPAMRGWVADRPSYIAPVAIGEVMRALGIGEVLASNFEGIAPGDHVVGMLGIQDYAVSPGAGLNKVDPSIAPLPVFIGTLGMPGMTAYFGLLDIGRPQAGETVVVSGAAGAVGSVVGQIGKLKGCRVVGIAGGTEKCAYVVEELGFDAAIDYKSEDVSAALADTCPNGIDIYFDNVGGAILDAALAHLARGARVIICGAISQYNATGEMKGPSNYLSLLVNSATMTGFVVSNYFARYAEGATEMAGWLASGKVISREDVLGGIENFPEALLRLFTGENNGKQVLQIAAD
jgi:NADPH-dependent curcumin reductase CurA